MDLDTIKHDLVGCNSRLLAGIELVKRRLSTKDALLLEILEDMGSCCEESIEIINGLKNENREEV